MKTEKTIRAELSKKFTGHKLEIEVGKALDVAGVPADLVEEIARAHFGVETMADRGSDSLDFYDVAIWSIRHALEAAYLAGAAAAKKGGR